jgi:multidrug resistance efflux pump
MSLMRLSLSFVGVMGVLAATIAAALIWLLITDPVTVADAVSQGDVSPLISALGTLIYDSLKDILGYL